MTRCLPAYLMSPLSVGICVCVSYLRNAYALMNRGADIWRKMLHGMPV